MKPRLTFLINVKTRMMFQIVCLTAVCKIYSHASEQLNIKKEKKTEMH